MGLKTVCIDIVNTTTVAVTIGGGGGGGGGGGIGGVMLPYYLPNK